MAEKKVADLRVESQAVGKKEGDLRPVGRMVESADRPVAGNQGTVVFPAVEIPAVHPEVEILAAEIPVVGNPAAEILVEGSLVVGNRAPACIPSAGKACRSDN